MKRKIIKGEIIKGDSLLQGTFSWVSELRNDHKNILIFCQNISNINLFQSPIF